MPLEMTVPGPDGNSYHALTCILEWLGLLPPPIIEWQWRVRNDLDRDLIEGRINSVILQLSKDMELIYLKRVRIFVAKDHADVLSTLPGVTDAPVVFDPKVIYAHFDYAQPKLLLLSATPEGLVRRPEWVDENVAHELCEFEVMVEEPYRWTTPDLPAPLHACLTSDRLPAERFVEHVVRERLANLRTTQAGYGREECAILLDELESMLRGYVGKPATPYYLVALLWGDRSFSLELAKHPRARDAWEAYSAKFGQLNPELTKAYAEFRRKLLERVFVEDFGQQSLLRVVEDFLRKR